VSTPTFSYADIEVAAKRLDGVAHRTPVATSRTLNELVDAEVFMKCENLQRVGAFKFRGAYNAVTALDPAIRAKGICTASSGNHAQAIALSAQLHGVPAVIVMPSDAPTIKLDATRGYGAEVVLYDRYTEDREALAESIRVERDLTLIPPFDHYDVIAGQGTLAKELIEDVGTLDAFIGCTGGGGLIAGCATAAKHLLPDIEVFGAEPALGDDTLRSLRSGKRVQIAVPQTICDGQQTTAPGVLTFAINQLLLTDVLLSTDDEVVAAMRFVFERLKLVVEPSGASALAGLLANRERFAGKRVGLTISGGNVGLDRFLSLIADPSALDS
jgi:threo-3-hydroxy-L-aspartate ammonia-lyase